MGIFSKLITAVKGGANEAGQAIVDSQSIRILEQEIREAKEELRQAEQARTTIKGKAKLATSKVDSLKSEIASYEANARKYVETDRQLALDCAAKVQELKGQLATETEIMETYAANDATLKKQISDGKSNVRRLEQQVDMVKATEQVQKAQVATSQSFQSGNAKMKTATDSLQRIKEKQELRKAELEAANEIANEESGASLTARLKAADEPDSAEDALAAILSKG